MKPIITLSLFVSSIFTLPAISQELPPPPEKENTNTEIKIFNKVEIEAAFPGGDNKWRAYLEKTVKTEVPQDKFAPPGNYTVLVQFVVDKEGNISDVMALTNHGFGMEEEVIRVIKAGPKWTPAVQDGRPVRAYRKQPVTFQVIKDFQLSTYELKAGVENTVELRFDNIKSEEIFVTVTNGTVKPMGDKSYIIKPTRPGKLLLSVSATIKKKTVDYGKVMLVVE